MKTMLNSPHLLLRAETREHSLKTLSNYLLFRLVALEAVVLEEAVVVVHFPWLLGIKKGLHTHARITGMNVFNTVARYLV